MEVDKSFLIKYFEDIRNEMKWRRELEFRLLQLLLVFHPIIATAMVTLYQTDISPVIYFLLSICASLFILPATLFVANRITVEHKEYTELAKHVIKVWEYFSLFENNAYLKDKAILDLSLKGELGHGKGYLRTIWLIWIVTATMITLVLMLGILKFLIYIMEPVLTFLRSFV